jgi:hypothetical protein
VRDIAPHFEHPLFLSATRHNGHSNSFSALLEILDPQRFCRGVPVDAKLRDEVMVRQLKEDIREIGGGFPQRRVVQVNITGLPPDAPELRLSVLLDRYRGLRDARLSNAGKRTRTASGLVISHLQQRLLSSIEAFARTLRVHRRTVLRQRELLTSQARAGTEPENLRFDLLEGAVSADDDRAVEPEADLTLRIQWEDAEAAQVDLKENRGQVALWASGAAAFDMVRASSLELCKLDQ